MTGTQHLSMSHDYKVFRVLISSLALGSRLSLLCLDHSLESFSFLLGDGCTRRVSSRSQHGQRTDRRICYIEILI